MNSLVSTLRVRRVLLALAAAASLFLTAGCGSSSPAKGNQVGFGNSSLSGTYVFSSTGSDSTVNGFLLAVAGSFTANGSGGNNNITGGMIDINGFSLTGPFSTAITGGTYSVNSDGRGKVTLNCNCIGSSITLDFVLTASSGGPSGVSTHGLITEFDGNGSGSGTLDLQNSGSLQGAYSFGLAGGSLSGNQLPLAMVGTFTPNNGSITAGLADINANGIIPGLLSGLTLTGSVTAGSPGTATFNAYNSSDQLVATYNFDVYMIDPTHLKFIETDTGQILAGDAFTQQTSLPQSVYAYTAQGLDSTGTPMAMGGFFTSDGSSGINTGLEDINDAGIVTEVTGITGNFTPFAGGRTEINLSGFNNGNPAIQNATFAAYPSSGGIQLLEIDANLGVTGGFALPQGSSTTIAAANYALNLTAINGTNQTLIEEDDIAQFAVTGSNYTGVEDINDQGSPNPPVNFDGTFAVDTAVAGHGSGTSSSGQFNFNYFLANNGATALILETDGTQLGVGSFEFQTTSQLQGGLAHIAVPRLVVTRTHGAFRGKAKQ